MKIHKEYLEGCIDMAITNWELGNSYFRHLLDNLHIEVNIHFDDAEITIIAVYNEDEEENLHKFKATEKMDLYSFQSEIDTICSHIYEFM